MGRRPMSRPSKSSPTGVVGAEPHPPTRMEAQEYSSHPPHNTLRTGVGAKPHQDSSLIHLPLSPVQDWYRVVERGGSDFYAQATRMVPVGLCKRTTIGRPVLRGSPGRPGEPVWGRFEASGEARGSPRSPSGVENESPGRSKLTLRRSRLGFQDTETSGRSPTKSGEEVTK